MVQSTFESFISSLKDMPAFADGFRRPTKRAIRRLEKILNEQEECHLPLPTAVLVTEDGFVKLTWLSPNRDIIVVINSKAELTFNTVLKVRDEEGEIVATKTGEGFLVSRACIDRMMAWFLADQTAQA